MSSVVVAKLNGVVVQHDPSARSLLLKGGIIGKAVGVSDDKYAGDAVDVDVFVEGHDRRSILLVGGNGPGQQRLTVQAGTGGTPAGGNHAEHTGDDIDLFRDRRVEGTRKGEGELRLVAGLQQLPHYSKRLNWVSRVSKVQ